MKFYYTKESKDIADKINQAIDNGIIKHDGIFGKRFVNDYNKFRDKYYKKNGILI